jgi:hypothetical protein
LSAQWDHGLIAAVVVLSMMHFAVLLILVMLAAAGVGVLVYR